MKRVCLFCGSSTGIAPAYAAAARDLGRLLAEGGLGLVYGGGRVGLMGEAADALWADNVRLAHNQELHAQAVDTLVLADGDELAFLPPVTAARSFRSS